MSIDDAKLHQIEKALHKQGLYVDPSLGKQVPADLQQQIIAAIKAQSTPMKVVIVPLSYDDPLYHGQMDLLLGTVHSDIGGDGVYFGVAVRGATSSIDAMSYGSADYGTTAAGVAGLRHRNEPGQQALDAVQSYGKPGLDATWEKLIARQSGHHTSTGADHQGDSGSSTGWAVGGGVLAVAIVLAVLVRARRRRVSMLRGPVGTRLTDRPFALPAAVLTSIGTTRDRERDRSAQAAVLALGEAIDTATMKPAGAGLGSWRAALDHYDLGRRILDREHSPADAVGAQVLAERGQEALAAALAGKAWTPKAGCFFNPGHGRGRSRGSWRGQQGAITVPSCSACARALGKEQEPKDILDFVVHERIAHYFDLDLGVWSETGYGSLDTDLVKRLFATG